MKKLTNTPLPITHLVDGSATKSRLSTALLLLVLAIILLFIKPLSSANLSPLLNHLHRIGLSPLANAPPQQRLKLLEKKPIRATYKDRAVEDARGSRLEKKE